MTKSAKLARLILIFAILFSVLLILPGFLKTPVLTFQLLRWGDVMDLLTPIILLPIYWLLFQMDQDSSKKQLLVFVVLAAFFAQGQGMHLSANSIDNLSGNVKITDVNLLTYFFDEVLSHRVWFIGINGLTALLIYRQWINPLKENFHTTLPIIAGVIYGITYFVTGIESQTVDLGIPFAILVTFFGFVYGQNKLNLMPILLFYLVAHVLALILFAAWGIYFHGLPEFSTLGLI